MGPFDWQQALSEILERWKVHRGVGDRIPSAWETPAQQRPDLEVLEDAGFSFLGRGSLLVEDRWTVEDLVGLAYATSFLPRTVVGDSASDSEADVANRVGPYTHDGTRLQRISGTYEFEQRPRLT